MVTNQGNLPPPLREYLEIWQYLEIFFVPTWGEMGGLGVIVSGV